MRKIVFLLLLLPILAISCSSYTIANGRANIVIPNTTGLPETKLNTNPKGIEASALFLNVGYERVDSNKIEGIILSLHDIAPDIIVLIGSSENQELIRSAYSSVYEIENTTIILSDRLFNTDSIELYIEDIPAILAQTEFPILSL